MNMHFNLDKLPLEKVALLLDSPATGDVIHAMGVTSGLGTRRFLNLPLETFNRFASTFLNGVKDYLDFMATAAAVNQNPIGIVDVDNEVDFDQLFDQLETWLEKGGENGG